MLKNTIEQAKEKNGEEVKDAVVAEILSLPKIDEIVEERTLLIGQQPEEDKLAPYRTVWSYPKTFHYFTSKAIPFSLVRMMDYISEMGAGFLLPLYGGPSEGSLYLAANKLIMNSGNVFIAPATATLFSIGARFKKCKNDEQIGTLIRKGFVCAVILSAVSTPILLSSGKILQLLGQDEQVCDLVEQYYLTAVLNIPVTILSSVMQQLALGTGHQYAVLVINAANNIISLGLGSVFMFGLLNVPEMGMKGMGLGYSVGAGVTFISSISYLCLNKDFRRYRLARTSYKDLNKFWKLLKLGVPYGVQMLSDFGLSYLVAIMIGWLGDDALAAARISEVIYTIPFVFIGRSPQVVCMVTGFASKCFNKELINRILYANFFSLEILMLLWTVAACLSSKQLIGLFTDTSDPENQQLVSLSQNLLLLYPIGFFAEVIRLGCGGFFRGMENPMAPMWNSIFFLAALGSGSVSLAYYFGSTVSWLVIARDFSLICAAGELGIQALFKIRSFFATHQAEAAALSTEIAQLPRSEGVFTRIYNSCTSYLPCVFGRSAPNSQSLSPNATIQFLDDESALGNARPARS